VDITGTCRIMEIEKLLLIHSFYVPRVSEGVGGKCSPLLRRAALRQFLPVFLPVLGPSNLSAGRFVPSSLQRARVHCRLLRPLNLSMTWQRRWQDAATFAMPTACRANCSSLPAMVVGNIPDNETTIRTPEVSVRKACQIPPRGCSPVAPL